MMKCHRAFGQALLQIFPRDDVAKSLCSPGRIDENQRVDAVRRAASRRKQKGEAK
jgi:hypothetical protein